MLSLFKQLNMSKDIKELWEKVEGMETFLGHYLTPLTEKLEDLASQVGDQENRIRILEQQVQNLKEGMSENDKDFASVFKQLATMAKVSNDIDAGRAVIVE